MHPLHLASWHQPAIAYTHCQRLFSEDCALHPQLHVFSLLRLCSFTATEARRTQASLSASDALGQPQGFPALNKGLNMEPVGHRNVELANDQPLLRV